MQTYVLPRANRHDDNKRESTSVKKPEMLSLFVVLLKSLHFDAILLSLHVKDTENGRGKNDVRQKLENEIETDEEHDKVAAD